MKIKTKFHGELTIQQDQLWNFPKGIPGFEDEKEFALLPIEGNGIFQVSAINSKHQKSHLSLETHTQSCRNYSFDIDEPTMDLLEIEKEEDVFVLGVISLKRTIRNINDQLTSTSNLPIKN